MQLCNESKTRFGLLDLPLAGVDNKNDWVSDTNASLAQRYLVPRVYQPFQLDLLWDNVHPTVEGKRVYAETLRRLLNQVWDSKPDFTGISNTRKFSAFSISDLKINGGHMRNFSRHGYVSPMLAIPENEAVSINLPKEVAVTGLITAIGPKSGLMVFQIGNENQAIKCYDQFCYYERVGGRSFKKFIANNFIVRQSSLISDIELLKGTKDTGPRIGGITHILYEE